MTRVRRFDVKIGRYTFHVDAFDWRSAQHAAQKRYHDITAERAPFVAKSAVRRARP
jgi:hypothetical protein